MRTIRSVLKETRPRAPLCKRVGISVQYASNIAHGDPIGSASTVLKLATAIGLTDSEIAASLREMHPESVLTPGNSDAAVADATTETAA